jgi:hypothetical protein
LLPNVTPNQSRKRYRPKRILIAVSSEAWR